jgi:hypothetical protein
MATGSLRRDMFPTGNSRLECNYLVRIKVEEVVDNAGVECYT